MSANNWPEWLEAAEREAYEAPLMPPPEPPDDLRTAEGIMIGVLLSAVLILGILCVIFGSRVVFGGG